MKEDQGGMNFIYFLEVHINEGLGGSTLSRVSDEDTQRTTERGKEVDLGCPNDQETSSSSFEDVPSCVNAGGFITWLISIREVRADTFWKRYSFPPNVQLSFPLLRPHFVARTKEDQGGMNFM